MKTKSLLDLAKVFFALGLFTLVAGKATAEVHLVANSLSTASGLRLQASTPGETYSDGGESF